ncbi:MAG: nicotinate-nucleotide adenylyltransferase [Bacillota bacterium]
MKKIGIFGGAFDPIHYGHLRPALEILEAFKLDSLRFMPTGQPPHRPPPVAPPELRLAMVRAAVTEEHRFQVDERELKARSASYTVDSLTELRKEFPDDALFLLVGMDAFLGFPGWHRWRELFGLAHVVVAHRPGWSLSLEGPLAGEVQSRRASDPDVVQVAGKVFLQAVTQLEISATRVRETAAAGRDLRYLVPDAVRALILDSNCYR